MDEHIDRAAHRRPVRAPRSAALVFVAVILLAACGPAGGATSSSDGDGLSIVATTTILGDVTSEIVGESGDVSVLMPAGTDPHNFEASARQLVQMLEADLIVANGANLEEHLQDPLTEAGNTGVQVFHAVDHVDALAFEDGHGEQEHASEDHAEEEGHAHEEGSVDPHFWMDPTRTAAAVRALGEQVGPLTDDASAVVDRAEQYAQQLEDLDGEISDTLAGIPDDERTLVTNHEAFNYFADRYGFTIVGTVIPSVSTGAEPSARDLEQLAHAVQEHQVRAVFAENVQPEQLAANLAQEAGSDVQVIELYSDALGAEGSDATTYVDMLRANARLIAEALGN